MSAAEIKCLKSPEKSEHFRNSDIVGKFRAFRLISESTKTMLRDSEKVIKELTNEINFSRNVEKNLRSQISSTQNRLIRLQEIIKKFIDISDRQFQNEKISRIIQEKIQEFEQNINEIRQKSQNLLQCAARDVDLLKRIKELESVLEARNNECDLMKMEIQTLTKAKKNMETEFQNKLKNVENLLEESQKKENETQIQCKETILYYKQHIQDCELKIERYEEERKSFLEDFELPKSSKINTYTVAWAESSPDINPEKRSPKTLNSTKREKTLMKSQESDNKIFQCSQSSGKCKTLNFKKTQNSLKILKKQKPQLEFLTRDSSTAVNSDDNARKRRLFSTNCNHYIE